MKHEALLEFYMREVLHRQGSLPMDHRIVMRAFAKWLDREEQNHIPRCEECGKRMQRHWLCACGGCSLLEVGCLK